MGAASIGSHGVSQEQLPRRLVRQHREVLPQGLLRPNYGYLMHLVLHHTPSHTLARE